MSDRAGLEEKEEDAERCAAELRQSRDGMKVAAEKIAGELRGPFVTAEKFYSVLGETEECVRKHYESNDATLRTSDDRIVQIER